MKYLTVLIIVLFGCSDKEIKHEVHINFEEIRQPVTSYLEHHVAAKGFNGTVYCNAKYLGADSSTLFLYYVCQEYYTKDNAMFEGTGMAGPVALAYKWQDSIVLIKHQVPRDGAYYSLDVKSIFPPYVIERLKKAEDSAVEFRKEIIQLHYNSAK